MADLVIPLTGSPWPESTSIRIASDRLFGRFQPPRGQGAVDAAAVGDLVRAALRSPLAMPPVSAAVVPGDQVCLVVDGTLPHLAAVVRELLAELAGGGVEASSVTVLCSADTTPARLEQLLESWPDDLADVVLTRHDPADEPSLVYLASTQQGQRVYVNRLMADAGLTIVVGRLEHDAVLGVSGTASELFPQLANEEARRFSRLRAMETRGNALDLRQRQACAEVGWLAGLMYALSLQTDGDDRIAAVRFGGLDAVQTAGEQTLQSDWQMHREWAADAAPDGILLTLESTPERPLDWLRAAAALATASTLVEKDGQVVLVAPLRVSPPLLLRQLADRDGLWETLAEMRQSADPEALVVTLLARALAQARITLVTPLAPTALQGLPIATLASPADLQKLVSGWERCVLIDAADRVRVGG